MDHEMANLMDGARLAWALFVEAVGNSPEGMPMVLGQTGQLVALPALEVLAAHPLPEVAIYAADTFNLISARVNARLAAGASYQVEAEA